MSNENKHTDTGASQPSKEVELLQARVEYLEARLVKAGECPLSLGVAAIAAERRRQVEVEDWSPEHDDEHDLGEIPAAAAAYAIYAANQVHPDGEGDSIATSIWPWDDEWWKPGTAKRNLEKAGSLIAAEWDRLDRAERQQAEGKQP